MVSCRPHADVSICVRSFRVFMFDVVFAYIGGFIQIDLCLIRLCGIGLFV